MKKLISTTLNEKIPRFPSWINEKELDIFIKDRLKGRGLVLAESIKLVLENNPDNWIFCPETNTRTSFKEADKIINRIGNGLMDIGIQRENRVCILGAESDIFLFIWLAVTRVGAVMTPINPRLINAPREIAHVINHSDAQILFIHSDIYSKLSNALKSDCQALKQIIVWGKDATSETTEGAISYTELVKKSSDREIQIKGAADDPIYQQYTSGTTGQPKGVICTNYSCLSQVAQVNVYHNYKPSEIMLNQMPGFHVGFITACIASLYAGCSQVMMPFDPFKVWETVSKEKVNAFAPVTPMIIAIMQFVKDYDKYDVSNLRIMWSGGTPMPISIAQKMRAAWPNVATGPMYGMSEATACISMTQWNVGIPDEKIYRNVGKVVSGGDVRIVNDSGGELFVGEVGEIIFRGPNVMKGYYKNPQATSEAIQDGWLQTGDLGMLDEEGFIYIVDRKKDMYVRKGENVYPAEVESVLLQNPKILEAAVIAIPDEKSGEVGKAFIVLKENATMTPEEVINHCKNNLGIFKVPEAIEFVKPNDLPRTGSGKIQKSVLKTRQLGKQ